MKRFVKFLPLLLIAVLGSAMLSSCDDDKEEAIATEALPAQAKAFVQQYFPSATIVSAQKDRNEYDVVLSEGTRIEFNKDGEWLDVDAVAGGTVPTGFYPAAIDTYVADNCQGAGINEISKETRGYDVELITGTELLFSYEGIFLGLDR